MGPEDISHCSKFLLIIGGLEGAFGSPAVVVVVVAVVVVVLSPNSSFQRS